MATFSASGSTLNLTLNTANESIGIVAGTSTVTLTDTGGTWSGTNSANVTGAGTNTLTITSPGRTAFTTVSIVDSAAGTSVNFNNSGSNTYIQNYTVALTNAAAGAIQFNGTTAFASANSLTAATTGNVTVNSAAFVTLSTGNLSTSATGTNKALTVNGGISVAGGAVTLRATGNLVIAANQSVISGSGTVSLGADITPTDAGDDGVGTLTINSNAMVYGATIASRGADIAIDSSAIVGGTYADLMRRNSPSAYYRLNESSGLISIDSSTTARNGTYTGGVTLGAPGAVSGDTAVNLDGINDAISVPVSLIDNQGSGTIMAWIKLDTNNAEPIFSKQHDNVGTYAVFSVGVESTVSGQPGALAAGQLAFHAKNGVPSVVSSGTVSTGVYHHVAVSFSSTSATLFIDGVASGSAGGDYSIPFDPPINSPTPAFANIGTWFGSFLDGSIDDVAIYPTALTTNEILLRANAAAGTSGVTIRSSLESRTMSIGGTNTAVSGINLTDAELSRIVAKSSGSITFGSSLQTGNILLVTASPATTAGTSIIVTQSPSGPGQIDLDDGAGTGTALNGNGGAISLTTGSGGISSVSVSNTTAEISTTGATVTLSSSGPIGTGTNRIQFADNSNDTQQKVSVSNSSGIYLDGLGSLTLGSISGGTSNPTVDVTARANLVVAANATVNSGTGTINIGADLTSTREGDNGVGTLSIGPNATVYGAAIRFRGADEEIDATATVEAARSINTTPTSTLTGLSGARKAVFDSIGNLFVLNNSNSTVSRFSPGATTPSATLTGLSGPSNLIVDVAGNLFVVNNNNTASKFLAGSTTPDATLTGLSGPYGMAFDSIGNLFIANSISNTVTKFAPGATTPSATLTGLSGPLNLAFDGVGNLFVSNNDSTVRKFSAGATTPSTILSGGASSADGFAVDRFGNVYTATSSSGLSVKKFPAGSTSGITLPIPLPAKGLAVDAVGHLYVAIWNNQLGNSVAKFTPGATAQVATLTGVSAPLSIAIDTDGDVAVINETGGNTVSLFSASTTVPSTVFFESSIQSRPMSIGGTNTAVSGINLTDSELSRIIISPNGTVNFGSSSQTGHISLVTASPVTISGAAIVVSQSPSGAGQIVFDNGSGVGTALNGNGGTVTLTSGTGGLVEAASNTAAALDIGNTTITSLTSSGALGTNLKPLLLATTNLSTNTSFNNSNQFLKGTGTISVDSTGLNAGSGTVELAGGTFELVTSRTLSGNVNVNSTSVLTGSGIVTGTATVNAGGTINPGSVSGVGNLTVGVLMFNGGTYSADFNGNTSDTISTNGVVNLNSGTAGSFVVNSVVGSPTTGNQFPLINKSGGAAIANAPLTGAAEGSAILVNGKTTRVSYLGGTGNDFVLSPIVAAPTEIALSSTAIAENNAANSVVGSFSTADTDLGDLFIYSLVAGEGSSDNAEFTIVGNQLTVNSPFNFETKNSYSVRVRTTDFAGETLERSFTIIVSNVNESPMALNLSSTTIAENSPANSVIGTFNSVDPDAGDTFTYSFASGIGSEDNGAFTVHPSTGVLTANSSFNYEVKNTYTIRIKTTDTGGLKFEKQFTINVTDVNEAPTVTPVTFSLPENVANGTSVGSVVASDPDAGQTLTFSITAGNTSGAFVIDDTGRITVANAAVLNFETMPSFSLTVEAIDDAGAPRSGTAPVTINLTNVNETPTDISLSAATVAENLQAGTDVGTFSTSDPDTGNTFTYTLIAVPNNTDDASFTIVGNTLKTAAVLDFETKPSYSILIRSTDQNGLSVEKLFTINLTNLTELQGIDVQLGQTQRSYLRYLDVVFDQSDDLMSMINNGRFQLTKRDLNGANPAVLSMPVASPVGNSVRLDFGVNGVGGNRNTNAGDGYYEMGVDLDSNGSFETKKYFYRLLGDVNGDRKVDVADSSLVVGSYGSSNPERDVNGDGIVNANDRTLVLRGVGRKLKDDLFLDVWNTPAP